MYIKYDMPVNLDEIVNLFEGLHPRMMQFTSLVYDYDGIAIRTWQGAECTLNFPV